MDLFNLNNKHTVITGASSGFGHHFAGVLAAAGTKVSLGARRRDKLQARVDEINRNGGSAMCAALDVCDTDSMKSFLAAAESAFGPIDVLVNNAGIEAGAKTYMMIDEEDWDSVIDTNLKSAWLMARFYTERVVANEQSSGNIINVSSITDTGPNGLFSSCPETHIHVSFLPRVATQPSQKPSVFDSRCPCAR